MEYTYLHGMTLDAPFVEDKNVCSAPCTLGSYQHLRYNPQVQPSSWSPSDPDLPMSEHEWLTRANMQHGNNIVVDASGQLSFQRPNIATFGNQLNLPTSATVATISSDPLFCGGDAAACLRWMQMCSLSSEQYFNEAMPPLTSESTMQQTCVYTSSSDCLHEADSSGSSERDVPFSRSFMASSTSEEISWRNSDVFQANLGGSVTGFSLDDLPEESSSVATDVETNPHSLSSLIRIGGSAIECVPFKRPVSWISSSASESGSDVMITSVVNQHARSLDPLQPTVSIQSDQRPPPYKRQRACRTSETNRAGPLSQSITPSLSQSISTRNCDYPVTPSIIPDTLYKDMRFLRQIPCLPERPAVGDHLLANGGFALETDLDRHTRSHRKQNATSIEPQSVAARHRRKKISERVRVLEKLIPGGNKMDTASMLDESIEYVKFLQLQVQLLESPGDGSEGSPSASSSPYKAIADGRKEEFAKRGISFGSHMSHTCTALQQIRPATSPLILSEILQQQLFKQKLCLVSLRQAQDHGCILEQVLTQ